MAIGRDVVSENGDFIRTKCSRPRRFDCCSQPFGKPSITEKSAEFFRSALKNTSFGSKKNVPHKLHPVIKKVGREIYRISEAEVPYLLSSIYEDAWTLSECRSFILTWADELKSIPSSMNRKTSAWGKCHKTQSKQQREGQVSSIQKSKLMEAQRILSEWTASLKAIPEGSVCAAQDVRRVLEDVSRQWKMGQIPNMLPALDLIMWNVLQEHCVKKQQTYTVQLTSPPPHQILVH